MPASRIDIGPIWDALNLCRSLAERNLYNAVRAQQYDDARFDIDTARKGMAAYNQLSEQWGRIEGLLAEASRSYDHYVTSLREPEGCSCHINPPCSYCTREADNA